MGKFSRQTEFTAKELEEQIENGSIHPLCMLVNELGIIRHEQQGTEEAKEAERFLGRILTTSNDDYELYAAYIFLKITPPENPQTKASLDAFESNDEHENLRQKAKASIEEEI